MKELDGERLLLLAVSTAVNIYREADSDEVLVLSDFFLLVGQALLTLRDRESLDEGDKKYNNTDAKQKTASTNQKQQKPNEK